MAGIYVHIPFCSSFCIYCDFYSELVRGKTDAYLDALSREAALRKDFTGVPPTTVYVGGGTPSLLSEEQFVRLAEILRTDFDLSGVDEFTLEANPDDVTPQKLALWRSCGVNRLSMGVQSFDDGHLRWMRRRHTAEAARQAFEDARREGFDNISLDLIFGFASLSDEQWDKNVSELLRLAPEHVSCYQMMLEEGSPLSEMAAAGDYSEPSQETCARQYVLLQRRLEEAGYRQYEISNFALPGREAKHNSAYWRREPYLGLGPAAHSFDGARLRCWNEADLDAYLEDFTRASSSETLSDRDVFNETVMLSLRTAEGLDTAELERDFPQFSNGFRASLDAMVSAGNLEPASAGRLRIPAGRLFVSDSIMETLFV